MKKICKLTPIGNKAVVSVDDPVGKTPGGIILPDVAKEKPKRGKVLAVGAGTVLDDGRTLAMGVTTGQTVLFSAYAGNKVEMDGEEYLIISEDEILAVLEE